MSDGYNSLSELCDHMGRGKVLYQWTPQPIGDDPNFCDIPVEYAVIEMPGRADRVMICGLYRGQWHCNAAGRLLVAHLLDELAKAREERDILFGWQVADEAKPNYDSHGVARALADAKVSVTDSLSRAVQNQALAALAAKGPTNE